MYIRLVGVHNDRQEFCFGVGPFLVNPDVLAINWLMSNGFVELPGVGWTRILRSRESELKFGNSCDYPGDTVVTATFHGLVMPYDISSVPV